MSYKFNKMRDQNIAYLGRHTDDECEAAMAQFTVQGFKNRFSEDHANVQAPNP